MIAASSWYQVHTGTSKNYKCGYCGDDISSEKFYFNNSINPNPRVYICHKCGKPTFFDTDETQTPGPTFGNEVNDINDEGVRSLYNEARNCMKQNAFTASVLCCRKLLMHIAVNKGAGEGLKFIQYVEYLAANHLIPIGSEDWVDHIREKGNEANHEIMVMKKGDAEDLISFSEMLLKLVYEFPANIQRKRKPTT